ncbi:MAG: Stk1 family PASTA domain-containing Ser/Thr kinase [Ruminiclostridium sp.]|nr:Stk1 family PASTA domain-containing Ser/Thr kinase [Ruminiclostridium sp.]
MDNNMDNMIGRRLDGRYELLELVGTGGMADIYKAKDITEDRIVAVKILKNEFAGSEDFLRRFRNESKAIALLSHPNIVKIYDVGFNEQIQFIVMEYIDGISLAEYIKLQGVLKWKDAVYFTVQILRALQHAHDRGIVHRDIKSQNVMMLPDGTIKVMDFGIARFNRETDKTLSEKAIGSVHYISPEQARGEMTDEKSDIYSVGVMLYEMLTGQKPFDGETPVAIALQHMQTPPKPLREINSSIPEGLEEITLKAMQKEPSMRYQTAGEMINDIEEFKKDPSIVFEYKYFSADGSTKYFDKVSDPNAPEQNAADDTLSEGEEDEDNDLYDDDDDDDEEVEERRSPLLPILFAVASVFVIMTAWLIFSIVTRNLGNTSGASDEMTMPNIIGMTLDDVKEKYPDLNLDIDRQYSTDYPENEVMDQKTPAGRTIKKSTIVNIVISNGPQKVEVDDYANLSAQDAQIKLEKKGLKPKLVYVNDDEVAKDIVIKTEPAAHSEVSQGTVVKVYVSNGKLVKAVNVPKFVGMTIEEARKEAEDKNLKLKEVSGSSNEYKEGEVIKQSIDANSVVNEDTEIEVTVCDGKAVSIKTEVSLDLPSDVTDTGTFRFEYFKDGVSFKDEERDMAVNAGKTITFEVSGSEPTTYTIKITNVADTSLNGVLAEISVDFKNEDTEPEIVNYNEGLFKELKYKAPDTTPEEPSSDPVTSVSGTVTLTLPAFASDTGTFTFTYTDSEGNVVKNSETKDMSLAAGKTISFDVSGTSQETKDYIIRITNTKDETKSGTLAEIRVDFTSGEAKQSTKSYNQGLFSTLKVSDPVSEPDANEDVSE